MHLLLLHGALGAASDFDLLMPFFNTHYTVHRFDFVNHGKGPLTDDPLSIAAFGGQVAEYLDMHQLKDVYVFGYSMGGYVACWLAKREPELFKAIYTLGTKFVWNTESSEKEAAMLDPRTITNKVPAYAAQLAEKHQTVSWQILLSQTAELMRSLGNRPALTPEDYQHITTPVLVARGEFDKMIPQEDADKVAELLGNGKKEMLAATPHPLAQVDPVLLINSISRFFG